MTGRHLGLGLGGEEEEPLVGDLPGLLDAVDEVRQDGPVPIRNEAVGDAWGRGQHKIGGVPPGYFLAKLRVELGC